MHEYRLLESQPYDTNTLKSGAVEMKRHPNYPELMKDIIRKGFEVIVVQHHPSVLVDQYISNQNTETERRILFLKEGMSYLDLEHEYDHIQQFHDRFWRNGYSVYTSSWQQNSAGEWKLNYHHPQAIRSWQNSIFEYHVRLTEFKRLLERDVERQIIGEHAKGLSKWSHLYWSKGRGLGHSKRKYIWEKQFFPDMEDLHIEVRQMCAQYI